MDQGKIYVSTRQTFEAIFEIAGASSYALFGTEIQVLESTDGLQLQIFSIKFLPRYSLSQIEIIYNPSLEPRYQYIQLNTYSFEQLYPSNTMAGDLSQPT